MNRFRFVDDNRGLYEVKRLCEVLKINRSSYYKWKSAAPARRRRVLDDAVLGARIKAVFTAENGCYGAKRVTAAINSDPANDDLFNHKRTARLMRQMGLFGYTKKRRVKTTVSAKRAPKSPAPLPQPTAHARLLKDSPTPNASACWNAKTPSSGRNERFSARRPNISRKRRTGEPLPVR